MINLIIIIILSLILGSVANMLIYRLPRELNIVSDRSRCTMCKHQLSFFDLIPILSFIFLQGKCHYCKEKIRFRYLIVEVVTVLIFLYGFNTYGYSLGYFKFCLFSYFSLILFFSDLETKLLPLSINVFLGITGLLFGLSSNAIMGSIYGACLGFFILFSIRYITSKIYKTETIGLGDVILLSVIGSYWGIQSMLVSLHSGIIVGGILGLYLLVFKKAKKNDYLAFGPFLIIGFWIDYFFGDQIVFWIYG